MACRARRSVEPEDALEPSGLGRFWKIGFEGGDQLVGQVAQFEEAHEPVRLSFQEGAALQRAAHLVQQGLSFRG